MDARQQHYTAKQKQDIVWDSFIWWAGLAVAVLAVPSIAIVFATIMPFRSDVAESIIFVLLCWVCTYLGMHLMKFYGMDITQSTTDERIQKTMQMNTSPLSAPMISPAHKLENASYIIDRRHKGKRRKRQSDRRGGIIEAMFYGGTASPSTSKEV